MDETFRDFHRLLSIAGISIFAKTKWDSNLWLVFQIINFIIGFLCFIFTTGFLVSSISDISIFINGAAIWTTGVIMSITLAICLVFRRKFRDFLEEMIFIDRLFDIPLIKYVNSLEEGNKMIELKNLVNDTHTKLFKFTRTILNTYLSIVLFVATMYLCSPIYEMAVRRDNSLRLLAFDMWFPWSLDNLYVYIASFIYHAYAGYLCCIAYPGLHSMILLFVGQNIRHLRVLTFILLNLDELVTEYLKGRNDEWQQNCTIVLCQCMAHFVKIKRFSNKLNIILRLFYLTLILVAIMNVCVCSVKIATSDKLSLDTMKYYLHELCFIAIVLMFCLLGQQVENESAKLEEAITNNWYIYNSKHIINVRIFRMALSQGMPIYIFGSITLSLPTFTWFIRTGMSFFTLVMSVIED